MWSLIGLTCTYDTYQTVKQQGNLIKTEENPLARLILEADNWDVSRFVGLKMAGAIFALGLLNAIYLQNPNKGLFYAFILSIWQALVVIYMLFGHLLLGN